MKKFNIPNRALSELFWNALFEKSTYQRFYRETLAIEAVSLESLRTQAAYNTGSISESSSWLLFMLSYYFQPTVIAEVGTFIGRSTLSLIRGLERSGAFSSKVLTCDYSNSITLPFSTSLDLTQFKMQSSTVMLSQMIEAGLHADFFVADGRLQREDISLISQIMTKRTVIILDDFEGLEKGVLNASILSGSLGSDWVLLPPPSRLILEKNLFFDSSTTALFLPRSLLAFTNQ